MQFNLKTDLNEKGIKKMQGTLDPLINKIEKIGKETKNIEEFLQVLKNEIPYKFNINNNIIDIRVSRRCVVMFDTVKILRHYKINKILNK